MKTKYMVKRVNKDFFIVKGFMKRKRDSGFVSTTYRRERKK